MDQKERLKTYKKQFRDTAVVLRATLIEERVSVNSQSTFWDR